MQIGDSTSDLTKMSIESELTIREHCDSVRQQVDIAREIAIENLHKASNTLMTEIDAYERECLSSWRAAKESTQNVIESVRKRMRAFQSEQRAYLQCVFEVAGDDELLLRLNEANKLAQELSDRKKELKAAMFGDKLVSFVAFPSSLSEASLLGELTFAHFQLPFKKLDFASAELKLVDFGTDNNFVLPLDHGQAFVTFKRCFTSDSFEMRCFDWSGRLVGSLELGRHVEQAKVAQCAPNEFVVSRTPCLPELAVYNSALKRLRSVSCNDFSSICCNSQFVFGLWDTRDVKYPSYRHYRTNSHYDDDDYEESYEQEKIQYSSQRIEVRHLNTLRKAFGLRLPEEYTIARIKADEHHVVAMSRLRSEVVSHDSCHWFMSIFDLATCNDNSDARRDGGKTSCKFFLIKRHIDLTTEPLLMWSMFLFDGWLVVLRHNRNELVWFDKNGKRSETTTMLKNISYVKDIYSSGSSLLFAVEEDKLFLKR